MPFDLVNAPGIIQELMSIVLQGLGNFTMAYLDNIIIISMSEVHKQNIQKSFDCIRQHSSKFKKSKCKYMQKHSICVS